MKRIDTALPGVCIIEPDVHGDARGYFMETYSTRNFAAIGIDTVFVQDNQSFSSQKGILRGIHFQNNPMSQAKLVRVTNKRMLFIPRGFGHGFRTLTDDVEFCYKVDNLYSKECDRGIRYNDPAIGVDWGEVNESLLSAKDTTSPLLADSDCNFVFEE